MTSVEHHQEAILSPIKSLNDSNTSDTAVQTKLVIREGQLRVEQVQVEVQGDQDGINISNISSVSAASGKARSPNASADSTGSEGTATSSTTSSQEPVKPDLVPTLGGEEQFKEWLVSHISTSSQYGRTEAEICAKVKRDFPPMKECKDLAAQLRAAVQTIPLVDVHEEESSPLYRTDNPLRYLVDSCITIHFFMKGTGGVEKMIKENHFLWYEDQMWTEMGLSYDCFQRILKGKVTKAMNGAIASKYNGWPGVKEFTQKHTFGAVQHSIKFGELNRLMKKEFNAPHDIVKHIKMDEVLKYCITAVPGVELDEVEELDESMVCTVPQLVELIKKIKHLLNNGVKNVCKDFAAFYPDNTKDWGYYHLTYQKLTTHFRNFFNPASRRRRSAPAKEEEQEVKFNNCLIYDNTHPAKKGSNPAIAVNTVVERTREKRRTEEERHYAERGNERRDYRNSGLAERDENTTVYLNTAQRSVVTVLGLPGTGKTTTLATMLGRTMAATPSTVLIISSNCSTTHTLVQYTNTTLLKACPAPPVKEEKEDEEEENETFIIHEVVNPDPTKDPKASPTKVEEGVVIPLPYGEGVVEELEKKEKKEEKEEENKEEEKDEGGFKVTELPWKMYYDPCEVLNEDSVGRVTALNFPSTAEGEDAEAVCGALEAFEALHSNLPKILIIDNTDCLSHPCNNSTVDRMIEKYRTNNMSIWIASTHPSNLPYNLLDFSDITVLHRYTSKLWHNELADHLSVTSSVYQTAQELAPGQAIICAPGAKMQHPIHSNSNCYPCSIVTPIPADA